MHQVFANRINLGDILSSAGIRSLLGREPKEHLCDDPFVSETVRRLQALDRDGLVVVGGGGLVMDYFTDLWRGLDSDRFTARLVLWGLGACDLKNEASWPARDLLQRVADKAELVVPRDELTRDFLGVSGPAVPCPSLTVMPAADGPGSMLLHVNNYTTVGAAAYDEMRDLGLQHARKAGLTYLETNNRIDHPRDLPAAVGRYRRAALVLSSALHGCILAVAAGRPVLAVSGDRKIEAFMAAAGLEDWVVDAADLHPLRDRLEALADQPPVPEFVERVRLANARVAEQVCAL